MSIYGMTMTQRGKYIRTDATRAKNAAASAGRRLSNESIERRTASRRRRDGYGIRHAMCATPTYVSWVGMIQRCTNPKTPSYKHYGGRGITVCTRWRKFEQFFADMGERPKDRSLDRIDSNGNYEPGNCRWATKSTQIANRRRPTYYDRPSRTPECGHPARPHKARGMCNSCWLKERFGARRKP